MESHRERFRPHFRGPGPPQSRGEESAAKIARRCGISEQTLYRYRDQFLEGGKARLASSAGKTDLRSQKIEQFEKQMAQRDQVIGELTIADRVSKKLSGECH